MGLTAIIYARVSTVRQAEDELPIDSQLNQCISKVHELDASVLRTFVDEGLSGTDDTRPAFQHAINYCIEHQVDYFVTWATSRFARNRVHAALYKSALDRAGTRIIYVSQSIERDTTPGWLFESIMEVFDELYSKTVAADTKRSMIRNAEQGFFNGGISPFGYEVASSEKDPKRKILRVRESDAVIVREIFRLHSNGQGYLQIAKTLNRRGHTHNGRKWQKASIARILKSPAVAGYVVFNKKDRATGQQRLREDWIVVKAHAPIIAPDVWEQVQTEIGSRQPIDGVNYSRSSWTFSGILRCGQCGSSLQIESAKGRSQRYHYYRCRGAHSKGACEAPRYRADILDEWLMDIFLDKVLTRDNMVSIIHEFNRFTSEESKHRRSEMTETKRKIDALQMRNEKLLDNLERTDRSVVDLETIGSRMRRNKEQINLLRTRYSELDSVAVQQLHVDDGLADEFADAFANMVRNSDSPAKKRNFFNSFVEGVTLSDTEATISYRPENLVGQQRAVPSGSIEWLPVRSKKEPLRLTIQLPAVLRRAA